MTGQDPIQRLVASMTVAELARHAGTTVEGIVAAIVGRTKAPAPTRRPRATGRRSPGRAAPAANARGNKYERAVAYRLAVREFVSRAGDWLSSLQVREAVGGDAGQCRRALEHLIAEGEAMHNGQKTAARRYRWV